jgi:hypothetical protein
MPKEQTTVPDIFKRALELARADASTPLRDVRRRLLEEFQGSPIPPLRNLTFPEQDDLAPHEDWTAGLSIVRRGIQNEDWQEIITGIMMSLDQTLRYSRDRGRAGSADSWHDRSVGIRGAIEKGVSKWMPDELVRLAERKTRES